MPSCVSLPPGLKCEQLVSTLVNTYGKVITIWDPADETPSYPPYVFAVDSPFTLGQDLNNNLAKDWPTGCGNNSSANMSCINQTKPDQTLSLFFLCRDITMLSNL